MAVVFSDVWSGSNGDAWDSAKWTTRTEIGTGDTTIQGAKGRQRAIGIYGAEIARCLATAGTVDNFDLTMTWGNDDATSESYNNWYFRCGANQASGQPGSCYTIELDVNQDKIGLHRIASDGSTYTLIQNSASAGIGDIVTHWMRIYASGSTIKAKWWDDGSGEPGTWQIDTTDATYSTGDFLLGKWAGSSGVARLVVWDDLTINDVAAAAVRRRPRRPVWRSSLSMN